MELMEYLVKRKSELQQSLDIIQSENLKAFLKGEMLMIESIENYIKKLGERK